LASKLSDANQKLEEAYFKWEELSERETVK